MTSLEEKKAIRAACSRFIYGHKSQPAAMEFERMAAWCRDHGAAPDVYGQGSTIQAFETKVAKLLGKDAAVFMPSGTMAQQIALRVWAEGSGISQFAMHSTSHIELHEHRGYSHLHSLRGTIVGNRESALSAADLDSCKDRVAALVVELPQREIGGILPTWETLQELKAACTRRGVKLHLDGARLWETRGFYGDRSYADIGAGFDSVYVSFYKGIGALSGALLAGPADFIEQSRIWLRRHGGNLFQLHPYVVSAAMNFDDKLALMPKLRDRTLSLAKALGSESFLKIKPEVPHINMFHLYIQGQPDALAAAHLKVAKTAGLWLTGQFSQSQVPNWSWFEVYVGENALEISNEDILATLKKISTAAV